MTNPQRLAGKTALVTGASRGIGKAIAAALVQAGARVIITGRTASDLQSAVAAIQTTAGSALGEVGDVAEEADVDRVFERIDAEFSQIDLIINNAGAFNGGPLDAFETDDWDRVIATNLRGPFLCTRAALSRMKKQQSGRIINIGSISAQRVRPNSAAYSTSKFGLWGLTQVTALEGREYGVTCCCLHPGNILTERREESSADEDAEPMISMESIAEMTVTIAAMPDDVAVLETIIMPRNQDYIGRG
ncbi:MAG: SDR family oxidoreductase [bacterium]|nr:SDR family oxidoreductase [bacterium]